MSKISPVLAIIPARGGSKGIPRKNLRLLAGRPLVIHTIEQALAARRVDRVAVSTEDPEIAAVAKAAGAEVVARPEALASDSAPTEPVMIDALEALARAGGPAPETVVLLQCTSPLRTAAQIDAAIDQFEAEGADSLLSAVESHRFLWKRGVQGAEAINYDPRNRPRRQDLEPQFMENGSIYVTRRELLASGRNRLGCKISLFVMPPESAVEIDDPEDFAYCEWRLGRAAREAALAALPARPSLLALDFDGVLTDNLVLVDEDGKEAVLCSRGDGLGLELLRAAAELPIIVLSRERNAVVAHRARKLGIECVHDLKDKTEALRSYAAARKCDLAEAIYVGNDANDLPAMAMVGYPVAVADARPEVRAAARLVLSARGGRGAVRELCDLLLEARARAGGKR